MLRRPIAMASRGGASCESARWDAPEWVFSMLYHHKRIDVNTQQLFDTVGRPQYLVDQRRLINELL